MEVYVIFGYNIVNVLRDFKQKVKKEIERLTTMNVQKFQLWQREFTCQRISKKI